MIKSKKRILAITIIFAGFVSTAIALPLLLKDTPSKHSPKNRDEMLTSSIKPDSLPLPKGVKTILPSQAKRPAPGTTPQQVAYTFKRWEQDDATGAIRWTVRLIKGVAQRELSGRIKGFLTTAEKILKTNKNALFTNFNQVLIGAPQPLPNGPVLETTLEALEGHAPIPSTTGDVTLAFDITTTRATGVATVVVTFQKDDLRDTTTYTISGFSTVRPAPVEPEINLRPARQKAQAAIEKNFQKVKRHVDHTLAKKEWNQMVQLRDQFLATLGNLKTIVEITSLKQRTSNDLARQADIYKQALQQSFSAKMRGEANNYRNQILPVGFVIPTGITAIPRFAFWKASFPDRFQFPRVVQTIAENAFEGAVFKTDPKLPDRIKLGAQAFRDATIPVGFRVPNNVQTTDDTELKDVFTSLRIQPWHRWVDEAGVQLETMIPKRGSDLTKPPLNRITFVAKEEFMHQVLPIGFTIPTAVTRILDAAFMNATIPTSFTLPNGLQVIDSHAFKDARLPDGFTLGNCAQLRSIESIAFANTRLPSSFRLPARLKTIGLYAFRGANINIGFQLPNNVNLPDGGAFEEAYLPNGFRIPKRGIFHRDTFKNAKLPLWSLFKKRIDGKTTWFSVKKLWEHWSIFNKRKLSGVKGAVVTKRPKTLSFISAFEFAGRDDLPNDFTLPEGITEIREAAFKGVTLPARFKIPLSITKIRKGAFARAKINSGFKLAPNVDLADEVFRGSRLPDGFTIPVSARLTAKTFYKTKLPIWSRWHKATNKKITHKWFGTYRLNKELELKKKGVGTVGFSIKGAIVQRQIQPKFIEFYEFRDRKLGADFAIPETVARILSGAFYGAKLPKNFRLPASVTTIDQYAFASATLPDDFIVPDTVKTIKANSFLNARRPNRKPVRVPVRNAS